MEEQWKDIENYEGLYQISNLGQVKSLGNNKEIILKPINRYGYLYVCMCKDTIQRQNSIHRLVCNHFNEKPEHLKDIPIEQLQVNHINEDKTDNRAENLEWCTAKYNANYGTRNKRHSEKLINGILSKAVLQFDLFGNFIKEWESIAECGRNGYIQSNISNCCNGLRKTHKGYIWKFKE